MSELAESLSSESPSESGSTSRHTFDSNALTKSYVAARTEEVIADEGWPDEIAC